jgi:hypothetical protein
MGLFELFDQLLGLIEMIRAAGKRRPTRRDEYVIDKEPRQGRENELTMVM